MQSYNYLANQLPRELVETYNDIQVDLLKMITRELKKGTRPDKVYQLLKDQIDKYDEQIQKVILIMFKDIEQKTIKSNERIMQKEYEKALDESRTNSIYYPLVAGALTFITSINNKLSISAVNKYAEVYNMANTGKYGYGSNINNLDNAYRYLANNGITIYENENGKLKSYNVESIVNRDVVTLVNKATAKTNMENFKNSGAKFIEVSSHPTARTWNKYQKHSYEDHSSWQGQVYYSGQAVDGYEEFESTCGYGEMLGICGINCYHQFQANYDGVGTQKEYGIAEVRKDYVLSQEQRKYERRIRKLKQMKAVYSEAGKDLTKINEKLGIATNTLKRFCEKYDLKYVNWRTQI